MTTMQQPTIGSERIELIDALRGFALFGVLLVNLHSLSLYGLLPAVQQDALATAPVDRWLLLLTDTFVSGTSITLFSLLFGVGFAMQMRRAPEDPAAVRRYVRRLLVLLVIGLLHALVWWGDILRYYAVLGLLLLPLSRLPVRVLAWTGVAVVVLAPILLQPVLPALLPRQIGSQESAALSLAAFSGSDWGAAFDANLARDLRMRIAVWFLPVYVLGRLMIGAALGRSGVLQDAGLHRRFWRRLMTAMVAISLVVMLCLALRPDADAVFALPWPDGSPGVVLTRLLRNAAPLCLGLAYLAGFVLLYLHPTTQRWLRWLAPVGRMALTNYLAQTLLAIALFYGIGLGIGPDIGLVGITAVAVLLFGAQALASDWWLARHRHGPMEWLWRRLTYGWSRKLSTPDPTRDAA